MPAGDKANYANANGLTNANTGDKDCDALLISGGWEPPEDTDEDTWSSELTERQSNTIISNCIIISLEMEIGKGNCNRACAKGIPRVIKLSMFPKMVSLACFPGS